MLYKEIKIGKSSLSGNIFLAPMAGVTDLAFRTLCTEYGADLTYTEMVSADGLIYNSKKTEALLKRAYNENNWAIQLFSGKEELLLNAAIELEKKYKPVIIDINAGCPVPKVVKTGAGSALLKEPEKIYRIIKNLKKKLTTPITIKIRSGWSYDSINYIEVTEAAAKAGVDALCIHPRTKTQGYSGKAETAHIKDIKSRFPNLFLIASGDLMSPEAVKNIFKETSCDAVMIARGAMGRPWIFEQIKDYLEKGQYKKPDISEIKQVMLRHLDYAILDKGERTAVKELRKHMAWYIKGIPNASALRSQIIQSQSRTDYLKLIDIITG